MRQERFFFAAMMIAAAPSPNFSSDMQNKATRRIATFASQVGGLRRKSEKAKGWF